MMGSGKTTVGREAARALGYRFVDLDKAIERSSGQTVPEIFEKHGENHFRLLETRTLAEFAGANRVLVSAGGGAPLADGNIELMRRIGTVVYLRASGQLLRHRLGGSGGRPMLHGNLDERIEELRAEREPVYESADFTLNVDGLSLLEIVGEVKRIAEMSQ
ncbi:MAG TPA: shikimate kinase, partial [Fimbriimonadales bacterium]|jgi:shikimate kinase|nr:shikimate kinase [Fimbriimonadales bacterium]